MPKTCTHADRDCWGPVSGDPAVCYAHHYVPHGGRVVPPSARQYHQARIRAERRSRRPSVPPAPIEIREVDAAEE